MSHGGSMGGKTPWRTVVLAMMAFQPLTALAAGPERNNIPVVVARVSRKDVPLFVNGLGTVRAFNSVIITSRVDGAILKLNFREGEEVKAGEVLVELDARPYRAQLAQAQANKLKDQSLLAKAQLDLQRAKDLATRGAGTAQQLEAATSQVEQYNASIQADEASIDLATTQLDYCQIRSPIDGRAGTRSIDVGNVVHANGGPGIVTINQLQPILVEFDLQSDLVARIHDRMKQGSVGAVAQDRNDQDIATGSVTAVDNQVNVATGTVRLKASFDNSGEALLPGQFVNVRVAWDLRTGVLVVPSAAVQRGPDETYVFVVDKDSVVSRRSVEVSDKTTSVSVIEKGLSEGETVIVDGQFRVKAGSVVAAAPAAEATQ